MGSRIGAHGITRDPRTGQRSQRCVRHALALGAIARAVRGGCRAGGHPQTQTVIGVANLPMPGILFEVEALAAPALNRAARR